MPTPWESCPIRFASTRFPATISASRGSEPPLAMMASIAALRRGAAITISWATALSSLERRYSRTACRSRQGALGRGRAQDARGVARAPSPAPGSHLRPAGAGTAPPSAGASKMDIPMSRVAVPPVDASGKLADNVMHFARVLRAAGLPVGPDKVIDALKALQIAGVERRDDFYWTLAAVFLDRREQFEIYDQAFHIFWRDPKLLERVMALFLPQVIGRVPDEQPELASRLAEALMPQPKPGAEPTEPPPQQIELDAAFTVSEREVLQRADFETMTQEELAQAKKLIASLRLPIPEMKTRRLVADPRGSLVDMRASLRASLRAGADIIPLKRRSQDERHPPLVVLCDISGSMSRYSRMFLHFLHAITNDRDRVHTFVFGTRLTNITRHLRHRDVDVALAGVAQAVADW